MAVNPTTMVQYVIQRAINNAQQGFNRYAINRSSFGLTQYGLDSVAASRAPIMNEELQASLRDYVNQPKIAGVAATGVTSYSARQVAAFTTAQGTTEFVSIVRGSAAVTMESSPMLHENNAITRDAFFSTQYEDALQKLMTTIEAGALASIEAAKNQFAFTDWPYALGAGDDFEVGLPAGTTKLSDKYEEWLQAFTHIDSYHKKAKLGARPNAMVFSPTGIAMLNQAKKWGAANEFNIQQFTTEQQYYITNALVESDGVAPLPRIKGYSFAPGSFGTYTWISPDARRGVIGKDANQRAMFIPELGFTVEVWDRVIHEDRSTVGGAVATATEKTMFVVDYVHVVPYNPDPATKASPIMSWHMLDVAP